MTGPLDGATLVGDLVATFDRGKFPSVVLDCLDLDTARRLVPAIAALLEAVKLRALAPPPPPLAELQGDDDDLLTDEAVARILSVPASYVADLRKAGDLPGKPLGGKYIRTRRGDLRSYVASLPHVTYSRRHDRRGGAAAAPSARRDAGRTGEAGGGRAE